MIPGEGWCTLSLAEWRGAPPGRSNGAGEGAAPAATQPAGALEGGGGGDGGGDGGELERVAGWGCWEPEDGSM
eukprot:2698523-Rhodomonas_salina.1